MFTKRNKYNKNNYFMSLALKQAQRELGNTKENPSVGCVIVKDNCVVSAASTNFNGRPHAEFKAIKNSKVNVRNLELYSTLEPCSNFGKTKPCVKYIAKNKLKRVYFSIMDPDANSYNKSIKFFKKKKITCKKGIYLNEVKKFYRSYLKYKGNVLPFVTAKIAVSKDLFSKHKYKKFITNKYSRGRVHLMRSNHDCIITSSKTVNDDNPMLNCRINGLDKTSPVRIILDRDLKTKIKSKIIKTSKFYKTIIFYNKLNMKKIIYLKKFKIEFYKVSLDSKNRLNLKEILFILKSKGFSRILLEAGLNLTKSFLTNNLIDDLHMFISGKKIGKMGHNSYKKIIKLFLDKHVPTYQNVNLHEDKLITYKIK